MPYIDRDEQGRIVGKYARAQYEGQELVEAAELLVPPRTPQEEVSHRFAQIGITAGGEWLLYSSMAGMLALGAATGKTEAQLYVENHGYKKAKDLAVWYDDFRVEHQL